MIIQPITLTTNDNILREKYDSGNIVVISADATEGSFGIDWPDAGDSLNTLFCINRKDEIWANVVYLNPILGQLMQNETQQKLRVGDSDIWFTDQLNYYHA